MPEKRAGVLAGEIPELERPIGCMTGILQIFDRHYLLASGRSAGRSGQKRLPAGHSISSSSKNAALLNLAASQAKLEKASSKSLTEFSSLSIESSRASYSSSSCSSFSSIDGNKSVLSAIPGDQFFSARVPKGEPDLRVIVKESMNRDSRSLAVKTMTPLEEAINGNALKLKDSPRPLLISRSLDGAYVIGIDRSKSVRDVSTESSRFSCDGTELSRSSDAQCAAGAPPAATFKQLPRLSLDSRKECLVSSGLDSPGHRRSNSVIANLMGLNALPDVGSGHGSIESCTPRRRDLLLGVTAERPRTAPSRPELGQRISELGFLETNKDFRALRILEALHAKKASVFERSDDESSQLSARSEKSVTASTTKHSDKVSGPLRKLQQFGDPKPMSSQPNKNVSNGGGSPRTANALSPRQPRIRTDAEKKSRTASASSKLVQEAASPTRRAKLACRDAKKSDHPVLVQRCRDSSSATINKDSSVMSGHWASAKKPMVTPSENVPSPVSVLDAAFFHDGPSPSLARISESFIDGETHSSEECWNPISVPDTPPFKATDEANQMKPENLKALIQKLELLSSAEDEPILDDKDDHRYIYEVLSASGLLAKDLGLMPVSDQLRTKQCLINPDLFLVLEQTKPNINKPGSEKVHRKLVFDMTNEFLSQMMASNRTMQHTRPRSTGEQLFRGLCREVDAVQENLPAIGGNERDVEAENAAYAKEALHQMKDWESFGDELQGIVLDVERSIFKDIIDDFVRGKAAENARIPLRKKTQRQLFKP